MTRAEPQYFEGAKATENFEQGMKALFKVPKVEVVKVEKRKKRARVSRVQSERKPRLSDKD